ncbi:hypothetical protein [Amycolatopsis sp. NPDC051372]
MRTEFTYELTRLEPGRVMFSDDTATTTDSSASPAPTAGPP